MGKRVMALLFEFLLFYFYLTYENEHLYEIEGSHTCEVGGM